MGSYDDGIFYYFGDQKPEHLTFEMWTDDRDIETCDLRLTSIDKNGSFPNATNTSSNTSSITTPTPPTTSTTNGTKTNATTKTNSTTNTTNATNSSTVVVVSGPQLANFSKIQWQDVAFFRFGYFNYQKMNLVSMVNKFTNETWYKVDLLIDWDSQSVTIYVNNTLLASDRFFTNSKTTISSANAIVLYNLTPGGHCRVKNIKVCKERCDCKFSTY